MYYSLFFNIISNIFLTLVVFFLFFFRSLDVPLARCVDLFLPVPNFKPTFFF